MADSKRTPPKRQQEALSEEVLEVQDQVGQMIYERACELIRSRETLMLALNAIPGHEQEESDEDKPEQLTTQHLAELIIADDAETFGRVLIDQVIKHCWIMAERELDLKVSENPAKPPYKVDGVTH